MKYFDNSICGNFLPELTPLSLLADLCWKVPQEAISHINSRTFSSSHYTMTSVANTEQYNKGAEWI